MHKYLEFISLGLLIENEPVTFNGHGNLKEHITCARWEADMFTPRREIARKQTHCASKLDNSVFMSEQRSKDVQRLLQKRILAYSFGGRVNSEDLVFVRHLNMTPAEMSQRAGRAISEKGFYNTFVYSVSPSH